MNKREKEEFIKNDSKSSGLRSLTVALFVIGAILVAFVIFLVICNQTGTITKLPDGSIKI